LVLTQFAAARLIAGYEPGRPGRPPTTPADEFWTLHIQYKFENETIPRNVDITYLPDGNIDFSKTKKADIEMVNTALQPMIMNVELAALRRGIIVDFWKVINWIFISSYWSVLTDLGQTTTTTYPILPNSGPQPIDFSSPIHHLDTNNIWVNDTLYGIYSDFLLGTIMPLLVGSVPRATFAPLNETNRIHPTTTTFRTTYTCNIRELKAPIPAIVSIVVSDYAFIKGGYSLFIFLAAWYEKRKYRQRTLLQLRI
jgi:hypothetical protein